jgi:creatinine amidohydrolase
LPQIDKIFYADLTWPEVKQVVAEKRVSLLPVGSTEQHGPHLPLKVDSLCPTAICVKAAERIPQDVIVMPTVYYGFQEHALSFPGTISISEQNYIGFIFDICRSLIHHGFHKIVIVNGHGSNMPYLDVASRRVNNTFHEAYCCVIAWWDLIFRGPYKEEMVKLRESEFPGGMAHACELETSLMLKLAPDLVRMEKAMKSIARHDRFIFTDLMLGGRMGDGPVVFAGITGRGGYPPQGIAGDPTVATKEKGEKWLEAAVQTLVEFIKEWKEREIPPVKDYH